MNSIRTTLARLRSDERGMTTVEYVIVLCLIGALSVGMWNKFGNNVKNRLEQADSAVTDGTDFGAASSGG